MRFVIDQTIELWAANAPHVYPQPLIGGNARAHEWRVRVTEHGQAADLSGYTAAAYLRRDMTLEDGTLPVPVMVAAEIDGGTVRATLPQEVYALGGRILGVMELSDTQGQIIGVAQMAAGARTMMPGTASDPGEAIPDLTELLAQVAAMREATAAAQAAAEHPPVISSESGTWMIWDADAGAYEDSGSAAEGAYYTPSVSETGDLSWTPSTERLPEIFSGNIRGPRGADGNVTFAALTDAQKEQLRGEKGEPGADGADYSFDPTVYGLPVLSLTGDISPIKESKDNKVTLSYVYGDRAGTCTLKGQGSSSYKIAQSLGEYGKYNYTIVFDTPFEAAEGWGEQKKYCLKANWIDSSHSRNVVSAKLWGMIVKSRESENTNLSGLVNGGAVDGFPVVVMVNDEFHGLYTFNIPKDGWMMGMVEDTTKRQAIFGANDHETATQFKGLLAGDESDFEMEFISDETNTAWATASLNTMIQACIDSWGGDLDDVVGQYLDWDSVIDYYIFIVILKGADMVDKNYLLSTFDGTKWMFTAYDMDSTYGLNWDGSGTTRAVSNISFVECADVHRAYELVKRFKTNALKARYKELRSNILSETRIMQKFENFAWAIASPIALEDVKRWPSVPGSFVNGIDQIGRWVRQRLEAADAWMDALPEQETPVEPDEPSEGYTNLVPTSTDTDGSIYNGVGYKENTRLSSSGGVSSTAQSGSVTTGFMPYTYEYPFIVRMRGATWLGESQNDTSTHWYLNVYDGNKAFLYGAPSGSLTESGEGGGFGESMQVSYDESTGITTFDFTRTETSDTSFAAQVKSGAYLRINAKGNGADLIVTVNEEIV